MNAGWVKLHRSLADWEWKTSPKHIAVFLDLLLQANHKSKRYRGMLIDAGSLTTSYQAISDRTGVSIRGVRTVLKDLKTTHEVTHKTTRHCSIISIVNWEKYQHNDTQSDIEVTSKRQPSDNLVTTNKNVKNVKNVKNTYSKDFIALFNDEEIITWLKDTGNKKIHDALLSEYTETFLIKEITNAFYWQQENKKRKAGTFLKGWCDRSNDPNKIDREKKLKEFDEEFIRKLESGVFDVCEQD